MKTEHIKHIANELFILEKAMELYPYKNPNEYCNGARINIEYNVFDKRKRELIIKYLDALKDLR